MCSEFQRNVKICVLKLHLKSAKINICEVRKSLKRKNKVAANKTGYRVYISTFQILILYQTLVNLVFVCQGYNCLNRRLKAMSFNKFDAH